MAPESSDSTRLMVIDADAHVIETDQTWNYLRDSETKYRPQFISTDSGPRHRYWLVNGRLSGLPSAASSDEDIEIRSTKALRNVSVDSKARKMEDIDLRLAHMTKLGIDIQVLHNSIWIHQVTNLPEAEVALSRSWNRWLAEIWEQGDGRLRWTCVVPVLDLKAAAEEMRFSKEHGAVGVCLKPYETGLMMVDPYFFPIYELAQELDLSVIAHIANGDPELVRTLETRYGGTDGFSSLRVPTMLSCYGLLRKNIPELFPGVRWGFVEASAQWVPWVANELQRRNDYEFTAENNPFKNGNVYVTTQTNDDIEYITRYVGDDVLVIGTDYGHLDPSSDVDAISKFRTLDINEDLKDKILSSNPARLYGI